MVPFNEYTDWPEGNDADENSPFARFIIEVEFLNRGPVKLRQRGHVYFNKIPDSKPGSNDDDANDDDSGNKYVRMFLGCHLFGHSVGVKKGEFDPNNLEYEAALVLWKRDEGNNDEIKVYKAISFGTKELTDKHKEQYAKEGSEVLPRVRENRCEHLGNKHRTTEISIPKEGLLYKVFQKSVLPFGNDTSNDNDTKYFKGDGIDNFIVDINKLAIAYENYLRNYIFAKRRDAAKRSAEEMENEREE